MKLCYFDTLPIALVNCKMLTRTQHNHKECMYGMATYNLKVATQVYYVIILVLMEDKKGNCLEWYKFYVHSFV